MYLFRFQHSNCFMAKNINISLMFNPLNGGSNFIHHSLLSGSCSITSAIKSNGQSDKHANKSLQ